VLRDQVLPGRAGLYRLLDDGLRRTEGGDHDHDLPVILLLGPRGSGKTYALRYLEEACAGSEGIPYALLDCAGEDRSTLWDLVGHLAVGLAGRWPEFGRLTFPRVRLGQAAVEPVDLDGAQAPVAEREVWDTVLRMGTDLAEILHVPGAPVRLVWSVARLVARARASTWLRGLREREPLAWYARRCETATGIAGLVKLNKLFHTESAEAGQILAEAFLADLTAAYEHRSRRFHIAVLLDNCETPAAVELLTCLANTRAGDSACDPALVVAASRTRPDVPGLADRWHMPWEPPSGRPSRQAPTPDEARLGSWRERRGPRHDPGSWWYPVCLRDLAVTELRGLVPRPSWAFVQRLTAGHLWSVVHVPIGDGDQVAAVREFTEKQAEYLLGDLAQRHCRTLVRWSAARDVDSALGVDIGTDRQDLYNELTRRLWLWRADIHRTQLHPVLRRILLTRFGRLSPGERTGLYGDLREYARVQRWSLDVAYYDLALDDVGPPSKFLREQFDVLDAESWITLFEQVTAAPRPRDHYQPPDDVYTELLTDSAADPGDAVFEAVRSMTAARHVLADPVGGPLITGDPLAKLADPIELGFTRLADASVSGRARYWQEARRYREMRAE
jgi:hypothetical protein